MFRGIVGIRIEAGGRAEEETEGRGEQQEESIQEGLLRQIIQLKPSPGEHQGASL